MRTKKHVLRDADKKLNRLCSIRIASSRNDWREANALSALVNRAEYKLPPLAAPEPRAFFAE